MCSTSVFCPLCYQSSFPNIDTLRHSLIKAANGPVLCPICNEAFLGLDKLTIHLFSHTTVIIPVPTATADTATSEPFPLETIPLALQRSCENSHIPTETASKLQAPIEKTPTTTPASEADDPEKLISTIVQNACVNVQQFKCDICELTFRSSELLLMHNKLIHRVSNDVIGTNLADLRYQCHLCAKVFKMKGSLRVHLKVVHFIGLQMRKDSQKINICQKIARKNAPIGTVKPILSVQPVQAHFELSTSTSTCNSIVKNNNNNSSNTTNFSGSGTNLIDRSASIVTQSPKIGSTVSSSTRAPEAPKMWECDICGKCFTTKYFLKKHKRLHTGEMPYTCNICGKTFTFQQSYHKHLLYHSDEKPHSCPICGRAFKELSTLHNHERIHSGEKPFKCEICGKCFRQRVSYLVHKRIHTGAMPYKCTACEKSFRYKVSQRTHKCTAQPPGTVVHQGGDLLEKLLNITTTSSTSPEFDGGILVEFVEEQDLAHVNGNRFNHHAEDHDADILQSIDEIVSESCKKMGIQSVRETVEHTSTLIFNSKGLVKDTTKDRTPLPTEKLESLCLYSPSECSIASSPLDVICEETLKTLLNETA